MVLWAGGHCCRLLQHMNLTHVVCGLLCYPESTCGHGQRPRSIPIVSTTPGLLCEFGLLLPGLSCLPLIALGQHVTAGTCGRTGHHKLHV